MLVSNKPSSINDLKYWFDASDISSLSLTAVGSATASVISIRDKVSGLKSVVSVLTDGDGGTFESGTLDGFSTGTGNTAIVLYEKGRDNGYGVEVESATSGTGSRVWLQSSQLIEFEPCDAYKFSAWIYCPAGNEVLTGGCYSGGCTPQINLNITNGIANVDYTLNSITTWTYAGGLRDDFVEISITVTAIQAFSSSVSIRSANDDERRLNGILYIDDISVMPVNTERSLPSAGSSYPIYYYKNINNQNSIYFQYTNNQGNTPNDRLSSTCITFRSTGSLYTVTKWGATSGGVIGQRAISIAPSTRGANTAGDFNLYYISATNSGIFSSVGTGFTTTIGLFNGVPNGTSSDINSISVDIFSTRNSLTRLSKFHNTNLYGSMEGYTNATYSLSTTSNELTIGDYYASSPGTNTGFKGYFCELLYFTRYLNDREHENVIQYLKHKWIN